MFGIVSGILALDNAVFIRVPEADLQHVVRLDPRAVAKVEAVEDFERAALQAIGLAVEDLRAALVDDARLDAAARHPVGHHEAGGAGADDEDIDFGVGLAWCHGAGVFPKGFGQRIAEEGFLVCSHVEGVL
jgi:hypothetical protein